jgi:hypothetical protein
MDIAWRTNNPLEQHLSVKRHKEDPHDRCGVYKLIYQCGGQYVGQTRKKLRTRYKEHMRGDSKHVSVIKLLYVDGEKTYFSSNLCVQTCSGAHPASCTMGTGVLSPGVKRGRVLTLTTHPHLVPRS